MKKETNFNFANTSKVKSNELNTIVKETLAMDFVTAKSFNIVDLWNIQRRSKTTVNSRKLATLK